MRKYAHVTGFVVLLAFLATPEVGITQETGTEETSPARSGFWFSGGFGYGTLGCDECVDREGGPTVSLALGGTPSRKLLLGVAIDGWSKEEAGDRVTASTFLGSIRFYPSDTGNFFLRGGLGGGAVEAELASGATGSETGFATLLGIGFDGRLSESVSLTPHLTGVGIALDGGTVNFGHIGVNLTVH